MSQNVPDDFVFIPGGYAVTYESLPDTNQDDGIVLTEKAVFRGVIFKRSNIAQAIAGKVGTMAIKDASDIFGVSSLTLQPQSDIETGTSSKVSQPIPFTFSLNGTTTLISSIDAQKLKSELVGKPRKSLNAILVGYPNVAKAEVIIRPFWKQYFPVTESEISVEIVSGSVSP